MQVKLNAVRAVAFDLDGTLIDTLPDLVLAVNQMLAQLQGATLPEARIRDLIGDGADLLVERAVTAGFGTRAASASELATAQDLFYRFYGQRLFQCSRLYPGVVDTLRTLAAADFALCCITNKASRFALPLLQFAGLADYFAFTLCADARQDRKPGPSLLLEAGRRLAVAPARMLYVGDSHTDVIAAQAAGCPCIAVTCGYHKTGLLEALAPDALIASLPDLLDYLPVAAATGAAPQMQGVAT